MYRKIYQKIKKYQNIVIARHIGPDPDCIASQIALRDIIKKTFPKKNVYAVGTPAAKFYHFGKLDRIKDEVMLNSLLIVVDTPDKERVDKTNIANYSYSIKIDHHPFMETFCDLEFIDEKASSVCQMIIDLCFKTRLKLTKPTAEILFMGLVSDTNRFMYYYTTPHTFYLIGKLIKKMDLNIEQLYQRLYLRPLNEVKLEGYIGLNMTVTEHKLGYIKIDNEILTELKVDSASAGNMINNFNFIEEVIVWVTFSEDKKQKQIRGAIRSRGPVINDLAGQYGGGGHRYASGVRLTSWDDVDKFIKELDKLCQAYLNELIKNTPMA